MVDSRKIDLIYVYLGFSVQTCFLWGVYVRVVEKNLIGSPGFCIYSLAIG